MRNYFMYENKRRNNILNTQNFLPPIVTGFLQPLATSKSLIFPLEKFIDVKLAVLL